MIGSYQTRITGFRGMDRPEGEAALSTYGELYSRVQRKLFAAVAAGRSVGSLKSTYLVEYGIPARMFNAVRVSLEGKVASTRAQQKMRAEGPTGRIARAEGQIRKAEKDRRWDHVHRKKRRLTNLRNRLAELEADIDGGMVRLCFGSKRLWRKQYHSDANGYGGHVVWPEDWRVVRSGEFFGMGSRDETGGCQLRVPLLPTTARFRFGSGCRAAWPNSMANTWSSRL